MEPELELAAEGSFDPAGYAALLRQLYRRRASGLLSLSSGEASRRVYFDGGHVAFASSNQPSDRLGEVLLAKGVITREQYDDSVRLIRETGKKQGTILVQIGAINPKDLFRGLILQVGEIAQGPFLWEGGRYEWRRGFDRGEEMIILKLHPGNMIREGLWKLPPSDDLAVLGDKSFVTSLEPPFNPDDLSLSPLEKKILAAPEGRSPLEMAAATGIPPKLVAKSFVVLCHLGFLGLPAGAAPEEGAAGRAGAPEDSAEREARMRDEIVGLSQKLSRMTHYQLLAVEPAAGGKEIKNAYIRRAREFHPDRFERPSLQDLAPLANEIFVRINEAHATLSDQRRRREYDQALLGLGTGAARQGAGEAALAAEQHRKGLQLLKCGEIPEAADAFRWAVRLSPETPAYHSSLGMALLESGRRLKEAEEHLRRAISLDYNNPQYYLNLGLVYKKGRAWDQAAEAFNRALKLAPGNAAVRRELDSLAGTRQPAPDGKESLLRKIFGR